MCSKHKSLSRGNPLYLPNKFVCHWFGPYNGAIFVIAFPSPVLLTPLFSSTRTACGLPEATG